MSTSWMYEPWTCPKCGITNVAAGKGTHLKWCNKREEHFWSKVDKTTSERGCWLYNGTISFEGYGYVNIGSGVRRRQYQAHRFAWTLLKGSIPKDACVLHTCDIRNCVNPDHLYIGDRADNANDKIKRNRDSTGTLTYVQAAEVKMALANYYFGLCAVLADKYGVSRSVISAIRHGRTYQHVICAAGVSVSKEKS